MKIPALVAVAVIALYIVAWFGTASVLRNQVEQWISTQRQAGLAIEYDEPSLSGFPARVVLVYPAWSVTAPAAAGRWTWRTPSLTLWAKPWTPLNFTVDLAGAHTVTDMWTSPGIVGSVSAARADIKATLTMRGQIDAIAVEVSDVKAVNGTDGLALLAIDTGTLAVSGISAGNNTESAQRHLEMDIANIAFPALSQFGVFAPAIKTARVKLDLSGQLAAGSLPTTLALWREAGGTLEVRELVLEWPPLSISGNGTVALNDRLQPVGALSAKFQGFLDAVDAMAVHGVVRKGEADIARIALGLMSRTPEGGAPEINLSVTVQDGKLYTGPLKLMDMPEIVWPGTIIVP